jgi:hypothetical protein
VGAAVYIERVCGEGEGGEGRFDTVVKAGGDIAAGSKGNIDNATLHWVCVKGGWCRGCWDQAFGRGRSGGAVVVSTCAAAVLAQVEGWENLSTSQHPMG